MKKFITYCLSLFFLIFLISGCKTDHAPFQKGGEIHIRLASEPEKLHPVIFPNPISSEVTQYIFLPLADHDPQSSEIRPVLIKELPAMIVESDGRISYTYELLSEAVWEDGSAVSTDDYLFTVKSILHPGTAATAYRGPVSTIDEIEKINNKKFKVYFEEYYMLVRETPLFFEVYPRHIYDPDSILESYDVNLFFDREKTAQLLLENEELNQFADNFNGLVYSREKVSGAGPYSLQFWESNQMIVLERKNNYWGDNFPERAHLQSLPDKMIFHIIPDETSLLVELRNKQIHIASGISTDLENTIMNDENLVEKYQIFNPELMRYLHLLLNNNHPILSDPAVRNSIAHLLDIDLMIESLENGRARRTIGAFNPAKSYYNHDIEPIPFDIEKACQILSEAGWADSDGDGILDKIINGVHTPLTLKVLASGELGQNIGLILKEAAKNCGVFIEVESKSFALIRSENLLTGNYDIIPSMASQTLTPDDPYQRFHSDNAALGGSNQAAYYNLVSDSLIVLIRRERDANIQSKLYRELQEQMHRDQPYIFLYVPQQSILVHKAWEGSASAKRPGYMANTFKKTGINELAPYVPVSEK
jgi:peptide/nickel transport system substrate-binding protein